MMNISASSNKIQHRRLLFKTIHFFNSFLFEYPFLLQLLYFVSSSILGFLALKFLKHRNDGSFTPRNLDFFFTSVSAATVSSMSTIEMEVFSNDQLIVLTILMFIGGEVFTSMVGLHFTTFRLRKVLESENIHFSLEDSNSPSPLNVLNQNELAISLSNDEFLNKSQLKDEDSLKYNALKFLSYVVVGYFIVIQFLGVICLAMYFAIESSGREVLRNKGIKLSTFSVFTIFSFFTNCGFVPTNENMIVFKKNSTLLLVIIPQVLFGNTLFPSSLRFFIWFSGKFVKKTEVKYLLKNTSELGYPHFLPIRRSFFLVITVFGFVFIQLILFCSLEWHSDGLNGMNMYQKIVGVLFQTANTRHAGGTVFDPAALSSAILALSIVMMYFPPYTTFLPLIEDDQFSRVLRFDEDAKKKNKFSKVVDTLIFSQLAHLAMFIILICITERKSIMEDPLNFSVLNIVFELTSAYGSVGFTTGYSCAKRLNSDSTCNDKWFGFSGRWSDKGKIVMIVVMFYGRLKKFNRDGGKAWKLL